MGIRGEPEIGLRRAFRVGNHTIVGFGLSIHDLSDEGSIVLQERGLGGRRHHGCGFFNPISRRNER
jgi:CRISPR-associated protein Cas6